MDHINKSIRLDQIGPNRQEQTRVQEEPYIKAPQEQQLEPVHPSPQQPRDPYLFMNTTVLAFLGDAVYEAYVRGLLVRTGQVHGDQLHRDAVKYVRAESQAAFIKSWMPQLTSEEQGLVKRARNKKITSKPKHADPVVYKWATAFEALLGYLHLAGKEKRLEEIMAQAVRYRREGRIGKENNQ